jgi:hypothetical protein
LHRSPSNTGGHEVREQRRAGEQLVPAVPLDLLLGGLRLDVCKIDAQGHDHRVLAGLRQTLGRNPQARVLVEFWLEGMETRGLQPRDVLDGYRALGRPLGLLDKGGAVVSASDEEILAAAEAWKGRFVDLVLGRRR